MDNVLVDTALARFGYIPDNYGEPGSFSALPAEWWATLPKTPEADDLITALSDHKIIICTKTCSEFCTQGKATWLAQYYPKLDHMIVTTKEHLTGVIIDDHPALKFAGTQIMWPQPYNRCGYIKEGKVAMVKSMISRI